MTNPTSTATSQATRPTTTWTIDPSHSLVEFSVKHMMFTTVKGRFGGVRGTIAAEGKSLVPAAIDVEIDAASIDTRDEQRDVHLRSPDFFDAENHSTLTYRSTRVERTGEDRLNVYGDLTIRGVTREVVLDTTIHGIGQNPWGKEVVGATAEGQINRKDFGLTWNVALEAGGVLVGDAIKIVVEVQAVKQD